MNTAIIRALRMSSQQLAEPAFDKPEDLVAWMGAVQAQDYAMSKWAVGIRLKQATLQTVEQAINEGRILRTHVMRPTWHLVPAEDIRWMLKLSAHHIQSALRSRDQMLGITEPLFTQVNRLIEKMLEGNKSLTRQEIALNLSRAGLTADSPRMNHFLMRAEAEGIICSGVDKERKPTYALLEERLPPGGAKELSKEESLAKLAERYFRSHSPAGLHDFAWWSGLSLTDARQAVRLIEPLLIAERFGEQALFVHQACREAGDMNTLHLLPAYDEYLISYKDRTSVLSPEHHPQAFTKQGIFYPIVVYQGLVAARWRKTLRKNQPQIEITHFYHPTPFPKALLPPAEERYKAFINPLK
ncbi:MAG: winged helix DNA-binding domain-containing protein [Tannerellaceae bacterium]|nr:winged helix DNA-binding domain-containing protein [Tannerellaceae bacterium]